MTQPTKPTDAHIDLILRFIEALHTNPAAVPPPDLDAADIVLARDLARTMPRSILGNAQRQRIWQRALAQAIQQRLAQGTSPAPPESRELSHAQSNGHRARQETESMFTQPSTTIRSTVTQPIPRQRSRPGRQQRVHKTPPRSRGIWITGLVAAISALVIGGLLLAGLGDSQPPATNPNMGAGIGVTDNTDQQQDADLSATPEMPVLEAVRDLPVQAGPGAAYPVLMILETGGKLDITGISEDGAWYQVMIPGGSLGWITKSAALIKVYGDLGDLPVVVVPTPTLVPTLTLAPVLASSTPTATATHTATPYLEATVAQAMTATAVNDSFNVTPTPILFAPGTNPTVVPVTQTPFLPRPTLSPNDFTGIYERMMRAYSKYGEVETLWSSDGRYLVALYNARSEIDDEIEINDIESPSPPPVVIKPLAHITSMAINPLGNVLALGLGTGEVRLYILPDAKDFVALDAVCEEECTVTHVEFNPTGTYLLITTESASWQRVHVYTLPETLYR